MTNFIKTILVERNRIKDLLWIRFARHFWGLDNYVKFIVLSRARVGSNLLISLLNSHPAVYAEGEILARLKNITAEEVVGRIFNKYPRNIRAVGFKVFYEHPVDDEADKIWNCLKNIEHLRVIHLKRRNYLRSILSLKIAFATDVWAHKHRKNNIPLQNKRVFLDEGELLKEFKHTKDQEIQFAKRVSSSHVIELYYEDLVNNLESEFNRIIDFLDLDKFRPKTILKKQNPESISDLIINYKDLKEKFKNTEWSKFFEY